MSAKRRRVEALERYLFDGGGIRVSIPDDGGTSGAVWNQLVPLGRWFGHSAIPKEGLDITRPMLEAMVANWQGDGKPALPLDYDHREDDIASGWIEDLEVRADGLWGRCKWTPAARQQILNDERRFISPSFSLNAVNRRTGKKQGPTLWGAALLNDPFFNSMPRVAASSTPGDEPDNQQEQNMDKKRICAALGLPEDTADEAVMAALEAKCKMANTADEKVKASNTAATKAAAELEAEKKLNASLTDRVSSLEKAAKDAAEAQLKRDTDALSAELLQAGRVTAKEAAELVPEMVAVKGIDGARKLFSAWPVRFPVTPRGSGADVEAKDGEALRKEYEAALDAEMKAGTPVLQASRKVRESNPKFKALS